MVHKRIKRVIIAGAGFSAPAKLPIQNKIIDRMTEVPESFLAGKMPEESFAFMHAYITVGLFLLDNYATNDYSEYHKEYWDLVAEDSAYETLWRMQKEDFRQIFEEDEAQNVYAAFSNMNAYNKHMYNYYSTVCLMRERVRAAIQEEKISVNLEDIFTAFDKSVVTRENLHGYTYAHMDNIRYSIMRLFIYYFSKSVLEHDFNHEDYKAFFSYLRRHRTAEPTTIITTNWDTLIEEYCQKNKLSYDYGFLRPYTSDMLVQRKKEHDLLLLKVHGSANWLRCLNCGTISVFRGNQAAASLFDDDSTEKCVACGREKTVYGALMQPELITPTMMKSLSNQLYTNLWASAAQELRSATHIIFLGYSLPIADFEFRYMLQKNVQSNAKIDVILTESSNPANASIDTRCLLPDKRYKDIFPRNEINFFYEGFGPYFRK